MIVVDNFLTPEDFKSVNAAWEKIPTGTWLDVGDKPPDTLSQCAVLLWNFFNPRHVESVVGYEYWTNTLSNTVPLDWHYDKDEALWELTGEIVTPTMGAVLYGDGVVTGGYLEVQQDDGEVERIQHKPNRAVFFEAGKLLHRVSPVKSGQRRTLACNIWERKLT